MKITVNLGLFFHDHRSIARLYLNENIKTIKDLTNRISLVFNIRNFFLKCDNCFLPSTEDINILSGNDEILVCPLSNVEDSKTEFVESEKDDTATKSKRKSKRKSAEAVAEESPKNTKTESSPKAKKKKKAKKYKADTCEIEDCKEISGAGPSTEEISEPLKKKKKKNCSEKLIENSVSNSQLPIVRTPPIQNLKANEINIQPNPVKSNGNHAKHESSDETSEDENLPAATTPSNNLNIQNLEKKINIIKTIIISPAKPPQNLNACANSNDLNVTPKMNGNTNDDPEVSGEEIPKRKRQRVRKRKPKADNVTIAAKPIVTPQKAIIIKGTPSLHVRFDEVETTTEQTVVENGDKDGSANKEEEVVPKIDINNLTQESIDKQPDVPLVTPKLNDVVAFKVLRLNEIYSPEISTTIVGKIVAISSDGIEFNILFGQDQCVEPQGIFSLNQVNEGEEVAEIPIKTVYTLSELLETKLLTCN